MARVPITEYAAKKLFFGEEYRGYTMTRETLKNIDTFPESSYVVKVDTGIKKRGKAGLVKIGISKVELKAVCEYFFALGHARCIIEPLMPHDEKDERYVSLELIRNGVRILHSKSGGVAIEEAGGGVATYEIPLESKDQDFLKVLPLREVPLPRLLETMATYHFSFLEINPYLIEDTTFHALDMAVEIDSAKKDSLPAWLSEHTLSKKTQGEAERIILEQDARSQASLSLHILNPHGAILTLFSGGGASLVAMDSLVSAGLQNDIINYSEYSGAPTRDETSTYVTTLLSVLFASEAPKKVVVIAGGVSNFTDIRETFRGIVDACNQAVDTLTAQHISFVVRRGGPHQDEGLAHLRDFLGEHHIPAVVHGPEISLAEIGRLVHSPLSL